MHPARLAGCDGQTARAPQRKNPRTALFPLTNLWAKVLEQKAGDPPPGAADLTEYHRHALHLAQVLKMALNQGPRSPAGNLPEMGYIQPEPAIPSRAKTLGLLALTVGGSWVSPSGSLLGCKGKR
ncbi:hypothetical protein BH20VER3_BH20VER3_05090 [soil metagenome]